MTGSFMASIFEILVYLIPGTLLLFGIYLWKSTQFDEITKKLVALKGVSIAIYLSLAMMLGVVNHQTSKFVQYFQFKISALSIDKTTNVFPANALVKSRVIEQLKDSTILYDKDQLYRYCLTYVREKSTGNIVQRIDRLSALSSFSVNLIFPLFLIFNIFFKKTFKSNTIYENVIYILIFLGLEVFLFIASIKYFVAIVYETYRLFLVLTNN